MTPPPPRTRSRSRARYNTKNAIRSAAELSHKYITGRILPDKAVDVIDEAGAYCKLLRNRGKIVNSRDIKNTITRITNVPCGSESDDLQKVKSLKANLEKVIFVILLKLLNLG